MASTTAVDPMRRDFFSIAADVSTGAGPMGPFEPAAFRRGPAPHAFLNDTKIKIG